MEAQKSAKRVLVVDDDPGVMGLVRDVLKRDYDVITAADGLTGLELLRREPVAAIVADQMMPGLTGIEILREALAVRPDAARILMTASDRIEELRDAVNLARVHRFVCKPLRVLELTAIVSGAIRELALEAELRTKDDVLRQAMTMIEAKGEAPNPDLAQLQQQLDRIARDEKRGSGLRVLIVDDDKSMQRFFMDLLGREGYWVTTAGSIAQAQQLWKISQYDLVLVDKSLPDGNGVDFVRTAHSDQCVFIMMSGYSDLGTMSEAMALGVADYLMKPLGSLDEILGRLRSAERRLALQRKQGNPASDNEQVVIRDPLTGLFNHGHLQETLEREVLRAQRHGLFFSLLLLDIDHFKKINDGHGHNTGDGFLRRVAQLLSGRGRRTDMHFFLREKDTAARYGGDEFAIILPDTDKAGAAMKADEIRRYVESSDFGDLRVPPQTVSIGVATYPTDAKDRQGLVTAADLALYAAKKRGRNMMLSYTPELSVPGMLERRADLEIERLVALDNTIAERAINYVYQPIIASAGNEILGYEALCRPKHAAFAGPVALFETAERAGRITELGRACRHVALAAFDQHPGDYQMFINLHPHELRDDTLGDTETKLDQYASRIVLEITETAEIRDQHRARLLLDRLRGRGFKIALDDLGAGYAGLNTLLLLRPDYVKLDMSLIRGIQADSTSARLINHLLDFCNGENVKVIAEGVETGPERDVVKQLGCPLMQGYFFAKPGPPFPQINV
jgi:diguanylate cyclase (GGDEF)-like protein